MLRDFKNPILAPQLHTKNGRPSSGTLKSNCKIIHKLAETQLLKKFHINFTREVIEQITLNKMTLLEGVLEPEG